MDGNRQPGQFVLAGSVRFLSVPSLQESLAGRAGLVEVWPFSQGEIEQRREIFLDAAFPQPEVLRSAQPPSYSRRDYVDIMTRGGFPEPCRMKDARTRAAWFANYVQAVTPRDIREMARVNQPGAATAVLRGLASLSAQPLVTTTLAARADLPRSTVDRYVALLEALFLIHRLPPWSRKLLSRAVRAHKVHLIDTGLLCYLIGMSPAKLMGPTASSLGPVMETFVANEIAKQATWAEVAVRLHHYRSAKGHVEVDLIIEDEVGQFVAVEVKAAETVTAADFKHLERLRFTLGSDFRHGFVVYLGRNVLAFGPGLTAIPLGMLWTPGW